MNRLTIGEQLIADRIRDGRRTFVRLMLLNAAAITGAVLLLMRG